MIHQHGLNGKLGDWFRRNKAKISAVVSAVMSQNPSKILDAIESLFSSDNSSFSGGGWDNNLRLSQPQEKPMTAQEESFLDLWVQNNLNPFIANISNKLSQANDIVSNANATIFTEVQAYLCVLKNVANAPTQGLSSNAIFNRALLIDSVVADFREAMQSSVNPYTIKNTTIALSSPLYNGIPFTLLGLPKQTSLNCKVYELASKINPTTGLPNQPTVKNPKSDIVFIDTNQMIASSGNNQPSGSKSMMKPLLILGAIIGGFFLFKKKK